jgi:predicted small lipoprotein YifL
MRPIIICLCSVTLLVACGLKGPLYLPEKAPDKGPEKLPEPQAVPEEPPPELEENDERLSPQGID